jgi:multiple sugar transport system permease protein
VSEEAMGFVWTKTRRKMAADTVGYTILTLLGMVILVPVLWMFSTALKSDSEVFLFPPVWIPRRLNWSNFGSALTLLPFARYFLNTSIITLAAVIGQFLSSPPAAYAFARLRSRWRGALFTLVLATIMLPMQVTMIPRFVLFKQLGWVDTYMPLVVPNFFGGAYFIFLLRQFFLTIPPELSDAARIDGCGYFGIYARIFLPLAKPAVAAMCIFTFVWNWNDFMDPLIYLSSTDKWTLALGLSRFVGMRGMTEWNLLMAASLVTILPCVTLFFFTQRFFIQGIVITGVKG